MLLTKWVSLLIPIVSGKISTSLLVLHWRNYIISIISFGQSGRFRSPNHPFWLMHKNESWDWRCSGVLKFKTCRIIVYISQWRMYQYMSLNSTAISYHSSYIEYKSSTKYFLIIVASIQILPFNEMPWWHHSDRQHFTDCVPDHWRLDCVLNSCSGIVVYHSCGANWVLPHISHICHWCINYESSVSITHKVFVSIRIRPVN